VNVVTDPTVPRPLDVILFYGLLFLPPFDLHELRSGPSAEWLMVDALLLVSSWTKVSRSVGVLVTSSLDGILLFLF